MTVRSATPRWCSGEQVDVHHGIDAPSGVVEIGKGDHKQLKDHAPTEIHEGEVTESVDDPARLQSA